jgi:GNAT superfamily N-acetyltransferase
LAAAAFMAEPFAYGMYGDSALARFSGMAHGFAEWPSAADPMMLGVELGGHLLGVAVATLPGHCGFCDSVTVADGPPSNEGQRIEREFRALCREAHLGSHLPPHAHVEILATEPALHGSGIGRVLMMAMLDRLRDADVEHVVLDCLTTRAAFYGHFGFTPVQEFADPGGPRLRALLMQADLSQSPI